MHKQLGYITVGVLLCLLTGAILIYSEHIFEVPTAEAAKRSFAIDGELYYANEKGEVHKLANNREVRAVYGETSESVLIGKGGLSMNELAAGVELYLVSKHDGQGRKVTSDLVSYALFDNAQKNIIYLTPEGVIKRQEIESGEKQDIATLASIPSLSPDDSQVVYKKMPADWTPGSYADNAPGIVVKNINNGSERKLTEEDADHAAYWTPDGKYIYFFGDNGYGIDSLFMIDSDGNNRTLLTNKGITAYDPKSTTPSISEPPIISPDGRYVIYESDREIWVIDVDTERRSIRDTRKIGYGTNPAWHSVNETISVVFSGNGARSGASLIIIDLDGNIVK